MKDLDLSNTTRNFEHLAMHRRILNNNLITICRKASQSAAVNKTRGGTTSRGIWGNKTQATTEKQHRQNSKKGECNKIPLSK